VDMVAREDMVRRARAVLEEMREISTSVKA